MAVLHSFWWICLVGLVSATEFPNPQKEWRMCGRYKASFICDPDFILQSGDAERLDYLAADFRRSTSCMCRPCTIGISIGIFVKNNISEKAIAEYHNAEGLAEMIRKRWNFGTCNDDIVIVLLPHFNMSGFSMGPTIKSIFPKETADQVLDDCRIHFESGWHYQGLESIVNSFNGIIVKQQKHQNWPSKGLIVGISLGTGMFLVLTVTAVVLLCRQSQKRKEHCEDIFEKTPMKTNRKQLSHIDEEKHELQKLKCSTSSDEDDEILSLGKYRENVFQNIGNDSMHFLRIKRQLSDVAEESSEESEASKEHRGTSLTSSYNSPFSNSHNMQITEL